MGRTTNATRKPRRNGLMSKSRRVAYNPMTDWAPPGAKDNKQEYRRKVLLLLRKMQEQLGEHAKRYINHCRRDYEAFEEDTGFLFGEKVALRIDRGEFLDNYITARVIGLSNEGDHLYLYSDLGGLNNGGCLLVMCYNQDTSMDDFLSMEDYRRLRRHLVEQDLLRAPIDHRCYTLMQMLAMSCCERESYWKRMGATKLDNMTTLDSAPATWHDRRGAPKVVDDKKTHIKGAAKVIVKGGENVIQVR